MRQRQHSGKSPSSVPFRACLSTDPHYSIDSRSRQSDLSLSLRFPVLGKHGGGLGQRARLLREEWCVSQLAKTPDSRCKCACRKRRGDIPSSPSFSILPSFPCLSLNRKPLAYYAHSTQWPWENVPPTETSLLSPSSSSPPSSSSSSSPPAFDLVRCQTGPRSFRR